MDYDVSISIGATANLGDLDKANKAVQDLGKQIDKLPPQLLPGGWAAHRPRPIQVEGPPIPLA